MRTLLMALGLVAAAGSALAGEPLPGFTPPLPPPSCDGAIAAAQAAEHIPPGLLAAIGVVESGRLNPATRLWGAWPWTIDVGGTGQFFASKEAAVAAVAALQAKGVQSIDVGCLQVNLSYHPHAFANLDEAFDPATNAAYGARFLRTLFHMTGDWTDAAADYHSQEAAEGLPYARQVMIAWGHPELAPAGLPEPPMPSGAFAARRSQYGALPTAASQYRAFARTKSVYGAFAHTAANSGGHALPPLQWVHQPGWRAPVETAQAPE